MAQTSEHPQGDSATRDVERRDCRVHQPNSFVLLVEDDDDIAHSILALLDDEGVIASRAANGQQALDVLEGGPAPCLIILDLTMPVMTGWEFLERIRKSGAYEEVPVAVFSAMEDERARAHAQGSLRKPPTIDQLLAMVDRFCGDNCRQQRAR